MSATFIRIPVAALGAGLSENDWEVLTAIAMHADKQGRAFPSMARIADITGIDRKNIPRSIARLEKRHLLRHKRMPRPNGGWQASHYEVLFERPQGS